MSVFLASICTWDFSEDPIKKAATGKVPLVVFPNTMSGGEIDPGTLAALQEVPAVKWVPLRCGGCWEGGYKAVYLR